MTDQHQHRASINLNDDVKVKLTDSGRDVLAMQQLRRQQDADGYIKFQLWELMNIFGVHVYNGCSIPFEFNRILLAPFDSAMTDQHQHRATPEQWALTDLIELRDRIQSLETHIAVMEPLVARTQAATGSALHLAAEISKLGHRVEALEATQHAHIEAKAAEAGARCAVEQLRSKPGSWQRIKTETTYGSDASIPELSQSDVKAAEMKWARTAPGMRSDATDQVLALQDQIRDGSLTLPEALKKINGDDQPVQQFIAKYLFTAGNIQQDSFCYDPSDSNSVSFDIAKFEPVNGCLKPGDNIKIAHRWGELPASGVYSTINYKVVSVSETENRAWTIRAVRVGTSDSEPAPTADDQLTLVNRVANALYSVPEPAGGVRSLAAYSVALPAAEARAAIREVAEWLRSEYPLLTLGTAAWANLLDNEANR
jgi:hypothetical protein